MQESLANRVGLGTRILGFGGSALMGRSGRKQSLTALAQAWEDGIRFFDTARCYGYGESETLLGEFLGGRRDQAWISTKFGITPTPDQPWKRVARPIARSVLSLLPQSRSLLLKMATNQVRYGEFSVEVLTKSLHDSLRSLRTDYVDILFMHDAPPEVLENDDLLAALDEVVKAGKARFVGISSDAQTIHIAARRNIAPISALQFPCNVFDLDAINGLDRYSSDFLMVANHPYGGVERVKESREVLQSIALSSSTPEALRAKLADVSNAVLADAILNIVTQSTGVNVVVAAMMKPAHISCNVQAFAESRFTSAELAWLRDALRSARGSAIA